MSDNKNNVSFYERPNVVKTVLPVGNGVPMGIERVYNAALGIGGAYGSWGECYSNFNLPSFVEYRLGTALDKNDILNLSELGFDFRQHTPDLTVEQHLELELEVGARLLRGALETLNWQPSEVAGVLIGMSGPIDNDYVKKIATMAGIPESALKVSVHKACDGSMCA